MTYLLISLLLNAATPLLAQSPAVKVQEAELQEALKEVDLTKTKKGLTPRFTPTKKEPKEITPSSAPNVEWSGITSAFQVIAYLLAAGLLGFLIFVIVSNIKSQQADQEVQLEERIEDVDASVVYNQAMKEGNYRLAIRARFIKILQLLQEGRWIQWSSDLTNRDFARQLDGKQPAEDFRQLAGHYERIWYGNVGITRQEFNELEPLYLTFIRHYE